MRDGWRRGVLGDLVTLDVQRVRVEANARYPLVGVLGFGRGLLRRPAATSDTTKYRELNVVRRGQLVYSKLKAFEGAITVVPADEGHAFASSEFPTYTCLGTVLPEYLQLLTQQPSLWDALAAQSKGVGGRRERLNPQDLLTVRVIYPDLDTQRRVVDLIRALDSAVRASERLNAALIGALSAQRDRVLWQHDKTVLLSELCAVDGRLVSPLGDNAALPHVGTDRIESGTGKLIGVVAAGEDGVTSGKYPFSTQHVIYSKIRPNLRKVAVPDFEGLTSADAYPLLPAPGVPRRYLQQLLLSRPFTERAVARSTRTKMPKINQRELMSIAVPNLDAEAIGRLAAQFEALVGASGAAAAEMDALLELRGDLLTALLSGEHEIPESYDELLAG